MNRLLTWTLALSMILGLSAGSAIAREKRKEALKELYKHAGEIFNELDMKRDGKLTVKEYKWKLAGDEADDAVVRFRQLDKDRNGFLTVDEFKLGLRKK